MEDWPDSEETLEGRAWTATARLFDLDPGHELLVYWVLSFDDEDLERFREGGLEDCDPDEEQALIDEMKSRFYGEFGDFRTAPPLLVWQVVLSNYILALEAAISAVKTEKTQSVIL